MIVSDSTPLIALARAGHLDLLPQVFGRLAVPFEVWDEVVVKGAGRPGANAVRDAPWIEVLHIASEADLAILGQAHPSLGPGELAAIVLAQQRSASLLLTDDPLARSTARGKGLCIGGTLSTVVSAKTSGIIASARELLDALRGSGFRLSERLYQEVLSAAGE